jgi:hypothetical protein
MRLWVTTLLDEVARVVVSNVVLILGALNRPPEGFPVHEPVIVALGGPPPVREGRRAPDGFQGPESLLLVVGQPHALMCGGAVGAPEDAAAYGETNLVTGLGPLSLRLVASLF